MRSALFFSTCIAALATAAGAIAAGTPGPGGPGISAPVGSAITYHGRLLKNGVPVNGNSNIIFKLWDAAAGGTQVGSTVTLTNQFVTLGLFTGSLNFGPAVFNGLARWIEVQVQGPGDAGFTLLTPRQTVSAAPYALYALGGAGTGSQWVESGGNLTYANGNTGVIGHGAAAPASGDGVYLSGNYDTVAHVWAYNYDISTPNSLCLQAPGGNVGIGTVTPTSRLEIAAQDGLKITGFQPYLTLKDTNAGGARGILSGSNGHLGFYPEGTFGVNPAMILRTNGRLGVGTINPEAVLHAQSSASTVAAILGRHTGDTAGVWGESNTGSGTVGISQTWAGVYGQSQGNAGVWGRSTNGFGVYGEAVNPGAVAGYFRHLGTGEALHVDGKAAVKTLQILGGADIVEGFETGDGSVEPGTVVVIDPEHPGELRPSSTPYDRRVAGIVSGAGGISPGLHLGQEGVLNGETPVAMSGRVYVRSSIENGRIRAGDLLTTSSHPGCAMRATDHSRALGAILGKAMTSLDAGTGLVLVLVNLQ